MKNKVFISTYLITIVLATFFFLFYSFRLERPFTIPIREIFCKSIAVIHKTDSLNINNLNNIAFDLRHTKPLQTIVLADSALKLASSINYTQGIGEAHRVIGIGNYYLNDNEKAIKNYLLALNDFSIINDLKKQAQVYNNIGKLYAAYDYNKSLEFYKKSLEISQKLGFEELNAGLYFNIASLYQAKSKYKEALFNYDRSNKIFEAKRDTINMIINSLFTGTVYYQLKNYKEAELRILRAIDGSIKKKLYSTLIESYTCLAKIYYEQGKFIKAERNINNGLKYSKKNENKRFEYDLLHAAYQLECRRMNHKKALKYLIQIHKYDSLLLSKNQIDNIGKTTKNQLQQQKIQENELIIEESKFKEAFYWWTLTIIFLLVLVSTLIGLGAYFVLQKIRKRKDLQLENRITLLEQKTLQGMMNPHFIFNVLNTIQYFINQENSTEANKILTIFARLMRKHLEICLKSTITLTEEIEYLSLYLALEKIRFNEKMDYTVNIQNNIDPEEIALPPMLIQPFVENAIWHGIIPKESKGLINLDFTLQDNELQIKIIDDGIGISNSKNKKSSSHISRGLELIQERVRLLNKLSGKKISICKMQTGKSGTEILITIPL